MTIPPGRTAANICRMARSTVSKSGASASELPMQMAASKGFSIFAHRVRSAGRIPAPPSATAHPRRNSSRARAIIAGLRSAPSTCNPHSWNIAACRPVPQATSTTLRDADFLEPMPIKRLLVGQPLGPVDHRLVEVGQIVERWLWTWICVKIGKVYTYFWGDVFTSPLFSTLLSLVVDILSYSYRETSELSAITFVRQRDS